MYAKILHLDLMGLSVFLHLSLLTYCLLQLGVQQIFGARESTRYVIKAGARNLV